MPAIDLLSAYDHARRIPLGRSAVSRAYRAVAPYFLSIPAGLEDLRPGSARASMPAVPWTRNHLCGVHAIAQCNLAEYAMGAVAEATVPDTHRWIPAGMTVEYRSIARGRLEATATLAPPDPLADKQDAVVAITITDPGGIVVTDVEIRIRVSRRPSEQG